MCPVTGTLGLFSLVDLFQLLASASRTGRLSVTHPRAPARVYFERGRVVHAEFGEFSGEAAVFELFADEQGSFEFTVGLPAPRTTVEVGTENLVLEAVRRLDEARRDEPREPVPRSAVPQLVSDPGDSGGDAGAAAAAPGAFTLQPLEVDVLQRVDGRTNVTEIALEAGLEPEEVMRVVARLLRVGVLKLRAKPPRTARLVTRLAAAGLPAGHAGVDPGILGAWARSLGSEPQRLACRRASGRVDVLRARPLEGAGPYIHLSRDTLIRVDLAANEPLLVRPLADSPKSPPKGSSRGFPRA